MNEVCMMLPSTEAYYQHKSNQLLRTLMKHISDEHINLNHIIPVQIAMRKELLAIFFFHLVTTILEFTSKSHNYKIWNLFKKIIKFCPECALIRDESGCSLLHLILRGDYFYDNTMVECLLAAAPMIVKDMIPILETPTTASDDSSSFSVCSIRLHTIVHYLLLNGAHSYHYEVLEQVLAACPEVSRSYDCNGHLPIHILFSSIPSYSHRKGSFYKIIEMLLQSNPYSAYEEIHQDRWEYIIENNLSTTSDPQYLPILNSSSSNDREAVLSSIVSTNTTTTDQESLSEDDDESASFVDDLARLHINQTVAAVSDSRQEQLQERTYVAIDRQTIPPPPPSSAIINIAITSIESTESNRLSIENNDLITSVASLRKVRTSTQWSPYEKSKELGDDQISSIFDKLLHKIAYRRVNISMQPFL